MSKEKLKGHWRSRGMIFDCDDIPECSYCEAKATDKDMYLYETGVSGVIVCENSECLAEHCMNEFDLVTWTEED